MTSHLHYEIVRARQQEIAARAEHARHLHSLASPRRSARQRIGQAVTGAAARVAVFSPRRSAAQTESGAP